MDHASSPRPAPRGKSLDRRGPPSGPRARDAVAFLIAALTGIFLARVCYDRDAAPLPIEQIAVRPSRFDPARAMADVRALVEACPRRVTGSAGAACAERFIAKRFRDLGLPVREQAFPLWLRGRRVTGRNVFALARGKSTRTMLLLAHYDAPTTSRESAADNASGVATILELARIFAGETRERTILFLATDAQVWGMIGADRFAAREAWKALQGPYAAPPYGAISLDFVKGGVARGIAIHGSGQYEGYTPLWLRRLVAGAIRAAGIRVYPETLPWQIVVRALRISLHDQGPLLRHGIPAINLSTFEADPAGARRVYHTEADRTGALLPGAVILYGRAAEAAARALNGAGIMQSEDSLSVSASKVLLASSLRWIAMALFLPLLALTASTVARRPAGLARAVIRLSLFSLPLFLALLSLRVSALANVLPRFELYPATPRDPFLTTWQPLPMILALGVAALAALLAGRAPGSGAPARRSAALLALVLAALWAWSRNDVAAMLFLGPASWLWPWMGVRGGLAGRALDAMLFLGGAAPYLTLLALFGKMFSLGPWILWYVPLQVAYGAFSLHAAAMAGMVLAAAIALLRSGSAGEQNTGTAVRA